MLEPDFLQEDPAEYMPTMPLPGIGGLKLRTASIPPPSGAPRRAVLCPRSPTPGPGDTQESTLGSPGDTNPSGRSPVDYLGLLPTVEEVRRRSVGSPIEAAPPPVPRELHVRHGDVVAAPAPRPPPRPSAPVDLEAKEFVGALRRRGLILGVATAGGILLGSLMFLVILNLGDPTPERATPSKASGTAQAAPKAAPTRAVAPRAATAESRPGESVTVRLKRAETDPKPRVDPEPAAPKPEAAPTPRSAPREVKHRQQHAQRRARRSSRRGRARRTRRTRPDVNADALLAAGVRPRAREKSTVDADALLAAAQPAATPVARRPAPRRRPRKDRFGLVMPAWTR